MASLFDKPILCPILVGRESYLDRLRQHLDEVPNGHGQTFLLAGEAGIGKSRLVAEAKAWAQQNGLMILQGNCFEPDRVLPYGPILDLLREAIAVHSAETLRTFASELVKLMPELRLLLPDITPSPALEPSQEKKRYFQTLDQFITGPSGGALVIIEDIHWCDDTSLEFLLYFARQISRVPIFLLLTYRDDELNPSLTHFLADMDHARLASELTLNRLSQADVEAMIAAIFEQSHPIKREFAEIIYSLTDGNPFFVEETLKALMVSGDIYYSMGGWTRKPVSELRIPRTVQDAVQRRTDQLGETTRQLLILAATAGRRFDFDLLQRLTQSPETELLKQVKELIAAQLVVEESADHFLFRHALTQQSIYSHLLVRERRALHRRIAEALEEMQNPTNNARLAELAYHTYEAGMWEKALDYSRQAGENSQHQLYTPRAALEHYNHAFEAARQLQVAVPLLLFHERGQVHETLGEYELAHVDYEAELTNARGRGDQEGEWQALIDLGFLSASRDYSKAGDYFRAALALAPVLSDPALVAHTLNRVGNWHLNLAQPADALQYHFEAARIFEALSDKHGLAATHDLLGITHLVVCDIPRYVAHYEQAMKLFREVDDQGGFISSLSIYATRGADYLACVAAPVIAPLADRLQDGQQALEIAKQLGARPAETLGNLWLGLSLASSGEYSQGCARVQAGLELAKAIDHRHFVTTGHMILGAFYLDVFSFPLAEVHLEQAQILARETVSHIWLGNITAFLADVHTQQNNFAKAEAILQTLLTPDLPMQTTHQRQLWRAKAEWDLAQGHAAEAFAITQGLIENAPDAGTNTIPRLSLLLGEAALALRRYATSQVALQNARRVAQALSLKPLLWRILFAQGRLARAQGKEEQSQIYFVEAQSLLDSLSADLALSDSGLSQLFGQRSERLMRSRGNPARLVARDQFDGLTRRERDIAALIAQGKSNKEIAETLVLSHRTVESHIRNILSKLNFTSRSQIAVWAAEKGLLKT
jgi:DNA-binding CsgD family transcriptional regulator/tetratricopeptide (TPR) repeat protein